MKVQSLALRTCTLLLCVLLLGGCASQYGTQTTAVNYYPTCYDPIAGLRQVESDFTKTVAGGTAIGAVLGGLLGGLSTGSWEGAAVGAVAGAAVGGTVGYVEAKNQEKQAVNTRMVNYLNNLEGDISRLDYVTASGKMATQCYDQEFTKAISDYKAGRIKKDELMVRYAEIKQGTEEANRIMGVALGTAQEKQREYQLAVVDEYKAIGKNPPKQAVAKPAASGKAPVKTPEKPKQVASASLEDLNTRTNTYSQSVAELETTRLDLARQQKEWDDKLKALES